MKFLSVESILEQKVYLNLELVEYAKDSLSQEGIAFTTVRLMSGQDLIVKEAYDKFIERIKF